MWVAKPARAGRSMRATSTHCCGARLGRTKRTPLYASEDGCRSAVPGASLSMTLRTCKRTRGRGPLLPGIRLSGAPRPWRRRRAKMLGSSGTAVCTIDIRSAQLPVYARAGRPKFWFFTQVRRRPGHRFGRRTFSAGRRGAPAQLRASDRSGRRPCMPIQETKGAMSLGVGVGHPVLPGVFKAALAGPTGGDLPLRTG